MLTNDYATRLLTRYACPQAVDWMRCASLVSLRAAWNLCPRGDWLGWIVDKALVPGELQRAAAFACSDRAVREYAPAALARAGLGWHADRLASMPPLSAETWWDARADAAAYAVYAADADAYAAADAAAYAADAAYAAAYAAAAAAAAAYAADAAAAAADSAARSKALAQAAHDLRTVLTWDVVEPYIRAWLGLRPAERGSQP